MKRTVLILGLLLLLCTPSYAAFTVVATTSAVCVGGSGGLLQTGQVNTTGADLFVVSYSNAAVFGIAVSDSANSSNLYTQATESQSQPGANRNSIWYIANPTTSTTTQFTAESPGHGCNFGTMAVMVLSGAGSTPLDQTNSNSTTNSVMALTSGVVTPTQNNELIVASLNNNTNADTSVTVDSDMTEVAEIPGVAATYYELTMAYKIQTSAATINPTFSWGVSSIAAANIATFKAGSSSNPSGSHLFRVMGVGQ